MKKVKVILADDHAILRYGISTLLSQSDDIEIVGEASEGDECIALFKKEQPDVSVIDIGMPGKNGIEVVKAIRAIDSEAKILILSMHSDGAVFQKALQNGINGYLHKSCPKEEVLAAIRSIAAGEKVFSESISHLISKDDERKYHLNTEKNLTNRELEILELVVAGYSSPQIAQKLYISSRTVDTHRNNLMQKLDIHNTASLVRFAIEHDLVPSQ